MAEEQNVLKELLLSMYRESVGQCRHHETQRATVTSAMITVYTFIIGLITFDKAITRADIPLLLFLIVLGAFGATFTLKHYERYRLHQQRSREYRNALDALFANNLIFELKQKADGINEKKFPYLKRLHHSYWWAALHGFVTFLGIILIVIAIFSPYKSA
ncbi:MAG: hypothetical protein ICV68_18350 [Pyrinomonadaceae bacterium]|nr:hypothetical protein [Pyrinomonadaceae bacterium]